MQKSIQEMALETVRGKGDHRKTIVGRLEPLVKKSMKRYYYGNLPYEDLLQEGRLRILKELDRFDPDRNTAFLGVAQLSLKYLYCELRRIRTPLCLLNEPVGKGEDRREAVDLLQGEGDIEVLLEKKEDGRRLREAFGMLDEKKRDLLSAYYLQERTLRELAESEGVHYMTLVHRKRRALETLKDLLEKSGFEL